MTFLRIPASYDPGHLLDFVRDHLEARNDSALAQALGVGPPMISKIRSGGRQVSASILIRMHKVTGLSIRQLRDLMGDRRKVFRVSEATGWYGCDREALARVQPGGGAA